MGRCPSEIEMTQERSQKCPTAEKICGFELFTPFQAFLVQGRCQGPRISGPGSVSD